MLKKAVAMARFHCTALPLHPYQQNTKTPIIAFFERKCPPEDQGEKYNPIYLRNWEKICIEEEEGSETSYYAPYQITPVTHIINLGTKKFPIRDKIRDIYNRAEKIVIQRPLIAWDEDLSDPTIRQFEITDDTRFEQIIAKINSAYEFNLPIEEGYETGYKYHYLFNKFTQEWELLDTQNYIIVTFYTNGAPSIESQQIDTEGGKVNEPIAPTKVGYVFDNWYTDPTFENEFDFDKEIDQDITLYANWNAKKYSITYCYEDSSSNLTGGETNE